MINRLTKVLQPERSAEEEAIEAAAEVFNADLLVAMVERAAHRGYLAGVEDGTKKLIQNVIDELGQARAHDMA